MKNVLFATLATSLATTLLVHSPASHAALIINEVDYDQPGRDTAEFIELYNTGASSLSLDGYLIDLVNGNNGSVYRSIDLSGFSLSGGGYFVVCNDATQVMNCNFEFTSSSGWLQNGAPDAIGLYDSNGLIDSLAYEGLMPGFTEGDALTLADSGTVTMSLGRINGIDSNNNLADFQANCLTPGAANIIGSGDCSTASVSPVPVPPALWLFASGLLGLVKISRRS